jgi:hypothetical protein
MNVPMRLVAFALVLAVAFGGAALAGAAIDPTDDPGAGADAGHGSATHTATGEDARGTEARPAGEGAEHAAGEHAADGHAGGAADAASGLAVAQDGFGLEVDRRSFSPGEAAPLRFRITDARGRVLRDEFELEHDRELHLIVVRRDTAVFQHLHPRKGRDGTWSLELTLREPGVYRAYADFTVDGEQHTLATDLFVPGDFRPEPLPAPEPVDETAGLAVELAAPDLRAGRETQLEFAVTRGGRPFEALQPYLGAKGHLVALREGDLAYLHVHPTEGDEAHAHADGSQSTEAHANEIAFAATFPTPGRYRLFLQVKTGGEVRTVAYTVAVAR